MPFELTRNMFECVLRHTQELKVLDECSVLNVEIMRICTLKSVSLLTYLKCIKQTLKIISSNGEPLKVMISGAPASGKGTQCEMIAQKVTFRIFEEFILAVFLYTFHFTLPSSDSSVWSSAHLNW